MSGEIQSQVNANLGGLDGNGWFTTDTLSGRLLAWLTSALFFSPDSSNSSSVLQSLIDANDTLFETRDSVYGDVREV